MVPAKVKEAAESHLGGTVTDTVLTVPTYFTVPNVRSRRTLVPSVG
jgi:molecular chaperone DnaK (HSP70)